MRISAIAPVGRRMTAFVDPISWHEASKGVQAVDPNEGSKRGEFQRVMKTLEENPHRRRTRVIEVVSAPGLCPGFHPSRPLPGSSR